MWRQLFFGSVVMAAASAVHITVLVAAIDTLPGVADQFGHVG